MIKKLLVMGFLCVLIGCASVTPLAVVPSGVNAILFWKDGTARKFYTGDKESVKSALKSTLAELSHGLTENGDNIVSKSDNHKFKWNVKQYDKNITCITCRIDFFGDKDYTELVYSKLDATLGLKTGKVVKH